MKTFIYKVDGREISDSEPWGKGWEAAKALAMESHKPIYRTVVETSEQVYYTGGFFNDVRFATPDNVQIF